LHAGSVPLPSSVAMRCTFLGSCLPSFRSRCNCRKSRISVRRRAWPLALVATIFRCSGGPFGIRGPGFIGLTSSNQRGRIPWGLNKRLVLEKALHTRLRRTSSPVLQCRWPRMASNPRDLGFDLSDGDHDGDAVIGGFRNRHACRRTSCAPFKSSDHRLGDEIGAFRRSPPKSFLASS
jgi:hypothetical protein